MAGHGTGWYQRNVLASVFCRPIAVRGVANHAREAYLTFCNGRDPVLARSHAAECHHLHARKTVGGVGTLPAASAVVGNPGAPRTCHSWNEKLVTNNSNSNNNNRARNGSIVGCPGGYATLNLKPRPTHTHPCARSSVGRRHPLQQRRRAHPTTGYCASRLQGAMAREHNGCLCRGG